jgi:hypothetical protein
MWETMSLTVGQQAYIIQGLPRGNIMQMGLGDGWIPNLLGNAASGYCWIGEFSMLDH